MKEPKKMRQYLNRILDMNASEALAILIKYPVAQGQLSQSTAHRIVSKILPLDDLAIEVLTLVYITLQENKMPLPPAGEFFTEIEIRNAYQFFEKKYKDSFPLIFENVEKLSSKEEFGFYLDIKDINSMSKNHLFHIVEGMQREIDVTSISRGMVAHVKYNDEASKEISQSILEGSYYPNTLRIHLLTQPNIPVYQYDAANKRLQIDQGYIALIDGQHRIAGIDYACLENSSLNLLFHIILTIGDVHMGQSIILQEEKRQEIDKEYLKKYEHPQILNIINSIAFDSTYNKIFKFVDDDSLILSNVGFINKESLIQKLQTDLLPSKDKKKDLTPMEMKKLQRAAEDVFGIIAEEFEDQLKNYISRPTRLTSVASFKTYAFLIIKQYQNNDVAEFIQENKSLLKSKVHSVSSILTI